MASRSNTVLLILIYCLFACKDGGSRSLTSGSAIRSATNRSSEDATFSGEKSGKEHGHDDEHDDEDDLQPGPGLAAGTGKDEEPSEGASDDEDHADDGQDHDEGGGVDEGNADANSGDAEPGPGTFKADFAWTDEFFTETKDFVDGKSPHGKVRIWYSKNLMHLISGSKFVAPAGSVAIKEFDNDGKPGVDGVAVMIKKEKGATPAAGDWAFELRDKWGALQKDADTKPCVTCHATHASTDFLAGTKTHVPGGSAGKGTTGPARFMPDYYDSPEFFSQTSKMIKGSTPHGNSRVWYSVNLTDLIGQKSFTAPVGSVAIKRFENEGNDGLAVMIKQEPGYDSENNDWRYELRDRYGNLLTDPKPGKMQECIACHAKAKATDFLSATKIKE